MAIVLLAGARGALEAVVELAADGAGPTGGSSRATGVLEAGDAVARTGEGGGLGSGDRVPVPSRPTAATPTIATTAAIGHA